jgi:hypothetical protein
MMMMMMIIILLILIIIIIIIMPELTISDVSRICRAFLLDHVKP